MLEKRLNELNIFALRDLARRTGVSSPTSKKKEELIKGIVEIMSGEKQPEINKTKQGRPPKVFGYDFNNVFNVNNVVNGRMILNQPVEKYSDADMTTVAGWLELVNNNSAILWVNKNLNNETFFVPKEVLKDLDVRMGARVVAEVCVDENQRVVKNIFSINDFPVKQFSKPREEYCSIEHSFSNSPLEFNSKDFENLNLKIAENIYVYGCNNNDNTTKIVEMLNDCKIENKIYVNISIAEKNKMFLSDLKDTENFIVNMTDEIDLARRIVSLAIERAKRILEIGERVLFVVDDVLSIMGIDKDNLNLVKKMVSITKESKTKGSITLLAIMPNENIIQIEKLADRRLKIVNGKIENK